MKTHRKCGETNCPSGTAMANGGTVFTSSNEKAKNRVETTPGLLKGKRDQETVWL